jgi:hypothetical protein
MKNKYFSFLSKTLTRPFVIGGFAVLQLFGVTSRANDFDIFNATGRDSHFSQSTPVTAGQEGNGGGLAYDAGTLKTVAECAATLNLLRRPGNIIMPSAGISYLQIDEATKKEVERILGLLPITSTLKDSLVTQAIRVESANTLIRASGISESVAKKIQSDYAQAMAKFGNQLPPDFIVMGAVTSVDIDATLGTSGFNDPSRKSKTIFLPEFDQLSPTSKAILLIHESRQRWLLDHQNEFSNPGADVVLDPVARLASILELDSTLHMLNTNDPETINNPMRALGALRNVIPRIHPSSRDRVLNLDFVDRELSQSTTLLAMRQLKRVTGLKAFPLSYFLDTTPSGFTPNRILSPDDPLPIATYSDTMQKTVKVDPIAVNVFTAHGYPAVQIFANSPMIRRWVSVNWPSPQKLNSLCREMMAKFPAATNPTLTYLWTPDTNQLIGGSGRQAVYEDKVYLLRCDGINNLNYRHEIRFENVTPAYQ